jgi:tetratricopeptide (TPR) repeat protein
MSIPELLILFITYFVVCAGFYSLYAILSFKKKAEHLKHMKAELAKIEEKDEPLFLDAKSIKQEISGKLKRVLSELDSKTEKLKDDLKMASYWGDADLYNKLGIFFKGSEEWEQGLSSFKRALKLNPKTPSVYYNIGVCCTKLEDWDNGIGYFFMSIARDEKTGSALYNLGWIFDELCFYEKAVYYYDKSWEVDKADPWPIYNKVCSLTKMGRIEEAEIELGKVIHNEEIKKQALEDEELDILRKKGIIDRLLEKT